MRTSALGLNAKIGTEPNSWGRQKKGIKEIAALLHKWFYFLLNSLRNITNGWLDALKKSSLLQPFMFNLVKSGFRK